ncbi:MAG: flagellar export protein FliJ [Bacillota bacterium]
MKRFRFTLEALERVKKTSRMQQEALLAKSQQMLDMLCEQMEGLRDSFEAHNHQFNRLMDRGLSGMKICAYNNYSTYLRESMEQLARKIESVTRERDGYRQALIQLMKEIQTLDKLREQQYRQYLLEVKREEEKSIGDFVSYQVTSA